jgi:nucleoside-diphosphate-sugar epimerase
MSFEESARRLVLVTGATGFVGSAVCPILARAGYRVRRAVRTHAAAGPGDAVIGEINERTDWPDALRGVKYVVHLAARAHATQSRERELHAEYERVNVAGTRRLAERAVEAGVRRFVFLSSVKANGEVTGEHPFRESDPPRPEDAYGRTKREAEELLMRIGRESRMDVVVLRSPLVYGPGVKGNFLRFMRLVASGIPLPLGSIDNRRSLVYVGNLASAILACVERPQAAARTYLVSDGEDLSTADLARAIGKALQFRPLVLRCPVSLLEAAARVARRSAELARLTRSLTVDSTRIRRELGWIPPYSSAAGLRETAQWYYAHVDAGARAELTHRAT